MSNIKGCGYMGNLLRIDLTKKETSLVPIDEKTAKCFIGGTGLGMKFLFEEVPKGVEWNDPSNRLMFMAGPLNGTVGGTGLFSVVTKGPMTNGPASSQSNGKFGAYIKLAGYDGLIIQGCAESWTYVYIHDDRVEFVDAEPLAGKNAWETEDAIEEETQKKTQHLSTVSIGPAGENLVRFASIQSDRGHVAAHNGVGAVMGSKKLKAVCLAKGNKKVHVHDMERLKSLHQTLMQNQKKNPLSMWEGTQPTYKIFAKLGLLPVKNYTEKDNSDYAQLDGSAYRPDLESKRVTCWGCPYKHLHIVEIKEGKYKGFIGEEPEYEGLAAMGPLIGNKDPFGAIVLCNEVDWLGLDINECGWLIAWMMECYEEGLLTNEDTDGLEMKWGNVEATREMIKKVALREGVGNLYAEGVKSSAKRVGGKALEKAVFTEKGNTPRGHDHRTIWNTIVDTATSSMGSDEVSTLLAPPEVLGLPKETDRGSAEGAAQLNAAAAKIGYKHLLDSMMFCYLNIYGATINDALDLLAAATGWDTDTKEMRSFGYRINTLMRAFGVAHGWKNEQDRPSQRYGSTSLAGAGEGKSILTDWDKTLKTYYEEMEWDLDTGEPSQALIQKLGLEELVKIGNCKRTTT